MRDNLRIVDTEQSSEEEICEKLMKSVLLCKHKYLPRNWHRTVLWKQNSLLGVVFFLFLLVECIY